MFVAEALAQFLLLLFLKELSMSDVCDCTAQCHLFELYLMNIWNIKSVIIRN